MKDTLLFIVKNSKKIFSKLDQYLTNNSTNMLGEKVNNTIKKNVLYSMGAGAIPIPLLDLAAVTAVQMDMIKQLCDLYYKDYNEVTGKALIAALTGSMTARYGASIVKTIPGIGSLLGGVSMVVLSGASTYAVGQVCANFLAGNVNLENIDVDKAKKMFEEKIEEGKQKAKEWNEERKEENSATVVDVEVEEEVVMEPPTRKEDEDVYALLLKLGELRDKNIISEEEFEEKKKELLSKF